MSERLLIVRIALRKMGRRDNGRLHTMGWLAEQLGVSRQVLYQVLNLEERSVAIEAALSEMFPGLPGWPHRGAKLGEGDVMTLEEFLES
jgi:hypothetical protein